MFVFLPGSCIVPFYLMFASSYGLLWRSGSLLRTVSGRMSITSVSSIPMTVRNGDARFPESYSSLGRADVLITDPPYCLLERRRKGGDLRDPKKRSKLDGEDTVPRYENVKEYKRFTEQWLTSCVQHGLKDGAVMCIWTNPLGKRPIVDVASTLGYELQGEYLWAKRTTTGASSVTSTKNEVLLRVYESALVLTKKTDQNSTSKLQLGPSDVSLPWSVITGYHDDDGEIRHEHPCHKPFAALEPLIRAWTRPGDVVMDCFAGSGGILQAVVRVGGKRSAEGIEMLPEWVMKANNAINAETQKK